MVSLPPARMVVAVSRPVTVALPPLPTVVETIAPPALTVRVSPAASDNPLDVWPEVTVVAVILIRSVKK